MAELPHGRRVVLPKLGRRLPDRVWSLLADTNVTGLLGEIYARTRGTMLTLGVADCDGSVLRVDVRFVFVVIPWKACSISMFCACVEESSPAAMSSIGIVQEQRL